VPGRGRRRVVSPQRLVYKIDQRSVPDNSSEVYLKKEEKSVKPTVIGKGSLMERPNQMTGKEKGWGKKREGMRGSTVCQSGHRQEGGLKSVSPETRADKKEGVPETWKK